MTRILCALALLALASCHSADDKQKGAIFLALTNRTKEPQTLERMWVSPTAVRIEREMGPDGTPKAITLAKLDVGVVYEIDPAKKEYREYRIDWLIAKYDKGDGGEYSILPYENAVVAGQSAEGYMLMREGRSVGEVWVSRDLETETPAAMGWRVYHRFRGFTNVLLPIPGVILKQELKLPDYAYRSEGTSVTVVEQAAKDLFDLPQGATKVPSEEK